MLQLRRDPELGAMLLAERAKDPPTCWKILEQRTGLSRAQLNRIWQTERLARDPVAALQAVVEEFAGIMGGELGAQGYCAIIEFDETGGVRVRPVRPERP